MYPGIEPADSEVQEDVSTTEPTKRMESAGRSLHDDALNNGDFVAQRIDRTDLKTAVKEVFDEFAPTNAWQQKELLFVINCPSGQKCLAKKLNTIDLIEADLLDEIDYFSRKLFPAKLDDAGNPIDQEDSSTPFSAIMKDMKKRERLFGLLDGLMECGIVKPKIRLVPKTVAIEDYRTWEGPQLPAGEVWANMVDFTDKMFIFGELNKPLDEISTFRLQSETRLADMASVESVSRASE